MTAGAKETGSLHGWKPAMGMDTERRAAVDAAFDYRGDVSLSLTDGRRIVGFVSNRDFEGPEPFLEILTADRSDAQLVALSQVSGVEFTGADAAAGKSWDLWLRKVAETEAEGKIAELYPDKP